jgi:putative phage-type endonuclease
MYTDFTAEECRKLKQGSDEWLSARVGAITASRVHDILPRANGQYRQSREDYMIELATELLIDEPYPQFITKEMEWGSEQEPIARTAYEMESGNFVTEVGIIRHPKLEYLQGSPDGIIEELKTGLEIKCPKSHTHLSTLYTGKINYKYEIQMIVNMLCAGYKKWDFVTYDPRLVEKLQYRRISVFLDTSLAMKITSEVIQFWQEVQELVKKFRRA